MTPDPGPQLVPVPEELLRALADEAKAEEPPRPPSSPNGSGSTNGYTSKLLVDRWLCDRGIAFRVKPEPDSKGRTVYVLKECPFDASHGDPDSCIMQAPDGQLSFHCFHNGCAGRGWQDVKAQIGKAERQHYDPPLRSRQRGRRQAQPAPTADPPHAGNGQCQVGGPGELPTIAITTIEHVVNQQAAEALHRDECLYQRGGLLVRVVRDTSQASRGIRRPLAPRIEPLPASILRESLTAVARWVTLHETENGIEETPAHPPGWCISAVHARSDWPGVRHLESVVDHPVLRPDGTVLWTQGYDEGTGLLLEADGPLPSLPECPTQADAIAARDALLEVIVDFPFGRPVGRSAWLAVLLTPLARFAFVGP
jgi:hypothetical protein